MSNGGKAVEKVLQNYKAAVLAKDVNAYIALYDDNIRIFDMWQEWVKSRRFRMAHPGRGLV
jgi:ketosteroid isomerase-like protein